MWKTPKHLSEKGPKMPKVKRRTNARRRHYSAPLINHLLLNNPEGEVFGEPNSRDGLLAFYKLGTPDRDGLHDFGGLQSAWRELRDELYPRWIQHYPGTRPYAWWCFEATQPRRRLDGCEPHETALGTIFDEAGQVSDRLAWFDGFQWGIPTENHDSANYETKLEYLTRLNLLEPDEAITSELETLPQTREDRL